MGTNSQRQPGAFRASHSTVQAQKLHQGRKLPWLTGDECLEPRPGFLLEVGLLQCLDGQDFRNGVGFVLNHTFPLGWLTARQAESWPDKASQPSAAFFSLTPTPASHRAIAWLRVSHCYVVAIQGGLGEHQWRTQMELWGALCKLPIYLHTPKGMQ